MFFYSLLGSGSPTAMIYKEERVLEYLKDLAEAAMLTKYVRARLKQSLRDRLVGACFARTTQGIPVRTKLTRDFANLLAPCLVDESFPKFVEVRDVKPAGQEVDKLLWEWTQGAVKGACPSWISIQRLTVGIAIVASASAKIVANIVQGPTASTLKIAGSKIIDDVSDLLAKSVPVGLETTLKDSLAKAGPPGDQEYLSAMASCCDYCFFELLTVALKPYVDTVIRRQWTERESVSDASASKANQERPKTKKKTKAPQARDQRPGTNQQRPLRRRWVDLMDDDAVDDLHRANTVETIDFTQEQLHLFTQQAGSVWTKLSAALGY